MTTIYTVYNSDNAYNANLRYDGVITDNARLHTTVPWRPQRGRSHIHRAMPSLPAFSGVHVRATPKTFTPEITISKAIQEVVLAPSRDAAKAEILDFVRNKEMRKEAQPTLPDAQKPTYLAPPKLAHETANDQVVHRQRKREEMARTHRARQHQEDGEVLELLSLLEGF